MWRGSARRRTMFTSYGVALRNSPRGIAVATTNRAERFRGSAEKGATMTRSIFDPTGGETERGGSMFTPPEARQISQMPPDVIDGVVETDATDVVEFDASGDE